MNVIIREMFTPLRILYKIFTRKEYREYMRMLKIGGGQRFHKRTIKLRNVNFEIADTASFFSTYKELIYEEMYKFSTNNESPVIIDFGANIGLSVYYFHKNYPEAKIYAYEADPGIFKYLQSNVSKFGNTNIHLYNKAVFDKKTNLSFYSEGADGGHLEENNIGDRNVSIETVDALTILKGHKHIDMLKMDIEGAERIVLPRISTELYKVDKLFIEYHSEINRPQCLANIINILSQNGFRVYIKSGFCADRPLDTIICDNNFDLQLDIFARRD